MVFQNHAIFPRLYKIRQLMSCLIISILVHLVALYGFKMFGTFQFGAAVNEKYGVMVDLADVTSAPTSAAKEDKRDAPSVKPKERVAATRADVAPPEAVETASAEAPEPPPMPQAQPIEEAPTPPAAAKRSEPEPIQAEAAQTAEPAHEEAIAPPVPPEGARAPATAQASVSPPPGGQGEGKVVLSAKNEKLSYVVSMLGLPVGSAELEAKNDQRVTSITLKVKSNTASSAVYPVDDFIETQRVDGKYLMTKIRQQEGKFRSDEMFTINLDKKRVVWTDNINYRNLRMAVPSADVLDTLSAIYSLRTRDLQVGKTEKLQVFDSETYAEVPVEVLRREEVRLPNLTKVNTVVVRPLQKTAGIFRRTGDILIWMTDDANKMPVKIVTSIALGQVTAELVSAKSEAHEKK